VQDLHALPKLTLILLLTTLSACARGAAQADDYFRWIPFRVPINEDVVLRWPEHKMPLKVHLPTPPEGLFDDTEAIVDSVRDGIVDWTDVAAPGIPSFEFVAKAGDADIPVLWASEPDGDWYIAFCAFHIQPMARRFGVSHILVTARWGDGRVADLHDVYGTMLHEMGHALGFGGHSPDPTDIMYYRVTGDAPRLSDRDRNTLRKLYSRPIGSRVAGARGRQS
jgi:predicted Zn-dependent protease